MTLGAARASRSFAVVKIFFNTGANPSAWRPFEAVAELKVKVLGSSAVALPVAESAVSLAFAYINRLHSARGLGFDRYNIRLSLT